MKARAVKEEIELTASELSNNTVDEKPAVGYVFNAKNGSVRFIAVDEFTGDETLFEQAFSEDDLRKVGNLIGENYGNIRKRGRVWQALTGGVILAGALTALGFYLGATSGIHPLAAIGVAFLPSSITLAIIGGESRIEQKLLKKFPVKDPSTIEGMNTLKAPQGLKSLITGEQFNLGSPNHESLVEAVKLLNKAWETNESIMKKSARQKEITGVYKTKELQNEQAELERDLAELKQELKDTESEISSILSRYDN